MSAKSFDIIVVGAGLVGASLALLISRRQPQLRLCVVEAAPTPTTFNRENFDPRVVALTQRSVALLRELELWDAIAAERACAYKAMEVWDGEGTGRIHFSCETVHQPQLGYIVENSLIVSALHRAIDAQQNIEWLRAAKVEALQLSESVNDCASTTALVLADGRQLNASLVLAADGAQSHLRELAQLQTREWDYGHNAIVTTINTAQPHDFIARQRFMTSGPLALLPLQRHAVASEAEHHCSIVWSTQALQAEQLMAMNDEEFSRALERASESCLGEVEAVDKRFSFPLRQRHAVDYFKPGFALLGDAAHSIHPLAGQGVNLGLQDVQAIAVEIDRAISRQIALGHCSILRRYQRNRKTDNLLMMSAMEGFKRLFAAESPLLRWARNEGLRQVHNQPLLKREIIKRAMGVIW